MQHSNKGLKPSYKYAMQSVVAIAFYFLAKKFLPNFSTEIIIPIAHISMNLGWFYPVFVYFMFTAESNAVNLTDGLDGLATGLMIIALTPFVAFAILSKNIAVVLLRLEPLNPLKAVISLRRPSSVMLQSLSVRTK